MVARPLLFVALLLLAGCNRLPQPASTPERPNILIAIADDYSAPHAGAYGDPVVHTPNFDRVARQGVLFRQAYVASPSCTPSRGAILTGQDVWRLRNGGNLWSELPPDFETYPDLLERAGYFVGIERKGWGPGKNDASVGRTRNPAGPSFKNFRTFLASRPKATPFAYWFGSQDPHRAYEKGAGQKKGLSLERVHVPAYLPDVPEVRSDLLDYYFEVERFDTELGDILMQLEEAGELENTLVVVTGDNGLPFPRAKANLYDSGTHVPLAIMWPGRIEAGRTVEDFVNLKDLAPTFLEAAGQKPARAMTGRSLLRLLTSGRQGRVEQDRDFVVTARERHAWVRKDGIGYPSRAIRTAEYLYIVNFEPDRWPAGDPDPYYSFTGFATQMDGKVQGYGDVDPSPSKDFVLEHAAAYPEIFRMAFAKRPAEELFVVADDPDQTRNVAADPRYARVKERLRKQLFEYLKETGDPRVTGAPVLFDTYPYYGQKSPAEESR